MYRAPLFSVAVAMVLSMLAVRGASAQSLLQRLAEQLESGLQRDPASAPRELPPPPQTPATGPGTLGVRLAPVTEESVRAYRLTVRNGALITAIEKGSSADRAGLPLGAVIVALNGRRVDSPEDASAALRPLRAGQEVEVTYYERDRLARRRVILGAGSAPALLPVPEAARPVPPPPAAAAPPPGSTDVPRSVNTSRGTDNVPLLPSPGTDRGGERPLLNRLGRILENVVAPAQATEPAAAPQLSFRPDIDAPTLQRQLDDLRQQVESLQRQVDRLEQQLKQREPSALPPVPR